MRSTLLSLGLNVPRLWRRDFRPLPVRLQNPVKTQELYLIALEMRFYIFES